MIIVLYTLKMGSSEPDGNEATEPSQGKRISRMMSNNLVVKFFTGSKSIERMTLKCFYGSVSSQQFALSGLHTSATITKYLYPVLKRLNDIISVIVTRFAKTRHNSTFIEIHFIAPSCFGHYKLSFVAISSLYCNMIPIYKL